MELISRRITWRYAESSAFPRYPPRRHSVFRLLSPLGVGILERIRIDLVDAADGASKNASKAGWSSLDLVGISAAIHSGPQSRETSSHSPTSIYIPIMSGRHDGRLFTADIKGRAAFHDGQGDAGRQSDRSQIECRRLGARASRTDHFWVLLGGVQHQAKSPEFGPSTPTSAPCCER